MDINPFLINVPEFLKRDKCKGIHTFDYWSEMTRRDISGMVTCRCAKCGEKFTEACGLDLLKHGRLIPLWQYGVMYA